MENRFNPSRQALHTAARRYCYNHDPGLDPTFRESFQYAILLHLYDQSLPWPEQEAQILGQGSSILHDLLKLIESVDPNDFTDVDQLFDFLLNAARTIGIEAVPDTSDDPPTDEFDRKDMLRYLDDFRAQLDAYMSGAASPPAPLPYRRYLTPEDVGPVWSRVEQVWGASPDEYWYPMLPPGAFAERPDVMAFDQLVFYWHVGWKGLRAILASLGVERLFQLVRDNDGDQCEIDVAFLELPVVGFDEMYFTPPAADWLLYLSHEQTVTVAGEPLLRAIQAVWPDWEAGLSHEQTGRWPEELEERLNF